MRKSLDEILDQWSASATLWKVLSEERYDVVTDKDNKMVKEFVPMQFEIRWAKNENFTDPHKLYEKVFAMIGDNEPWLCSLFITDRKKSNKVIKLDMNGKRKPTEEEFIEGLQTANHLHFKRCGCPYGCAIV